MEEQYLYFFIYYPRTQSENSSEIILKLPDKKKEKPQWIYSKPTFELDDKKFINYKKIFKISKSKAKGDKYHFEFEIGDDRYIINFDSKKKTFIYDISLDVGKRILEITSEIDQNQIDYHEKIDYFIEAIKNYEEEEKRESVIKKLYEDSIDLYENKKEFSFLISLFLKIYKNDELGPKLSEKFKKMNENLSVKNNLDRKPYLKEYTSMFETIASEADEIIKKEKYKKVEFYGIILSYLNYYDYQQFSILSKDLAYSKPDDFYEILLIYNNHFINPIKQNLEFFNKFIKYTIEKKNYKNYQIGLKYIKDIEIFLNVIFLNKEEINTNFNNYLKPDNDKKKKEKYFITMDDKNYKFAIEENSEEEDKLYKKIIPEVIKYINEILDFSKDNNIFIIHFTSDFWKYILNFFRKPVMDNISNCSELRKAFFEYYGLVNRIFQLDDKFKIKNDANTVIYSV